MLREAMTLSADLELSDMEGAALGLIASEGPVTSYAVVRAFAASPSEFWSGSAGAVYPLMRRLAARDLIAGREGAQGRRKATWYTITPAGSDALKTWLLDADRAAGMGFDPLRTRLAFAALMTIAERQVLLEEVTRRTAALAEVGEPGETAEARVLHQSWIDMRLAWLKRLVTPTGRSGPF